MDEYTTTGTIRRGRLQVRFGPAQAAALRQLKDGDVLVTVRRQRAARSLAQNAWYWGVIVQALSNHTGYTPDDIHELLKAKFLPKQLAVCDGNGVIEENFVIGGSSAKLNKVQFGEYCEAIRRWAAETLDVNIPDPVLR